MKAVILAAGIGYRLVPLTYDLPKALIKVGEKAFLDWVIGPLIKKKIKDIVIVIGYKKEILKDYLLKEYSGQLNMRFVENDIYDKTNNIYSLWLASRYLKDDDLLLFECDEIFEECVLDKLLNAPWENVALVDKYKKISDDGTVVLLNQDNDIIDLLTKDDQTASLLEKNTFYKTVNIYKFSRDFLKNYFFPYLDVYIKSKNWDKYYEIILKLIISLKQPKIKGLSIEGCKWIEVDTLTDLRRANFIFSSSQEQLSVLEDSFGGFWNYNFEDFNLMGNDYFPGEAFLSDMSYIFKRLLKEYPSRQSIIDAKLANALEIKAENIVSLNGSSQGIKIMLDQFDLKYLLPVPSFNEYIRLARNFIPYKFDLEKLDWHLEKIAGIAREQKIEGLILINPHNPTSSYVDKSLLLSLLQELRFLKLIIIDESFADFTEEKGILGEKEQIDKFANLLIIKSLSKSMGIFGLRLGAAISANKDWIKIIKENLPIWNINSFAEYFLENFSRYRREYETSLMKVRKARDGFYEKLSKNVYLEIIKPQANFIFFRLKDDSPLSAEELSFRLYKDFNILVKNCTDKFKQFFNYQDKGFIRVAVRTPERNERFAAALEEIMGIKEKR